MNDHPPKVNPDFDRENPTASGSYAPYKVYNIGNNQSVKLMFEIVLCVGSMIVAEVRMTGAIALYINIYAIAVSALTWWGLCN